MSPSRKASMTQVLMREQQWLYTRNLERGLGAGYPRCQAAEQAKNERQQHYSAEIKEAQETGELRTKPKVYLRLYKKSKNYGVYAT